MRIVTGCIEHETSTFTPVPTTWESFFERFGEVQGAAILEKFRGTNTPTGGFIEAADAYGFELIPTISAEAHPSGPVSRPVFDRLVNELLDGIRAAGAIDGVLLQLHGAMVAEGVDDGEGHISRRCTRPGWPHDPDHCPVGYSFEYLQTDGRDG